MNQYAQIFASSDMELSRLEEYRYLSIQILATDILHQLLNDPTLPAVGLQELACFIHHKLLFNLQYDKASMKCYDVLIFDEIHALLDDSMFVGGTGQLLKKLEDFCCTSIRLYLSATPEAILPHLPWAPRPYSSKILHMPRNYSYIVPHFFANEDELLKCINEDTSNKKWLIFMPHISDARRFNKGLRHSFCMPNGEEREKNPDKWYDVLENERFEEKVCLVTAIVDAGVNFKDSSLVNIAIFSTNPNTYNQVLGRKRRSSSDEKVHAPTVSAAKPL